MWAYATKPKNSSALIRKLLEMGLKKSTEFESKGEYVLAFSWIDPQEGYVSGSEKIPRPGGNYFYTEVPEEDFIPLIQLQLL